MARRGSISDINTLVRYLADKNKVKKNRRYYIPHVTEQEFELLSLHYDLQRWGKWRLNSDIYELYRFTVPGERRVINFKIKVRS